MDNMLPDRLFGALARHDHDTMASCYSESATFRDIAFNLHGRHMIHGMWHMICLSDISCKFKVRESTARSAIVEVVDTYEFSVTKRPVTNVITSRLRFEGEQIIEHVDEADPKVWAHLAWGPPLESVFGRSYFARHALAHLKLRLFMLTHRQRRVRRAPPTGARP